MFFDQFLERFRPNPGNQRLKNSIKGKQLESNDKEISEQSLLQASNEFLTKNELNQALEEINKAIQDKSVTNQQLLLKAQILIRKRKFNNAREALKLLSNDQKDLQTSIKAKNILKTLPQLQLEASSNKFKALVKDLHKIAQKYESKLFSLPSVDDLSPDLDITILIRKEAGLARSAELPGLSLELIDRTLKDGQKSLWLLHDKALSLNMMGQKQKALAILRDLKKTTKNELIANSINTNIEVIRKNSKHFQFKSNTYLAKQSKLIARSHGLDTTFIPEDAHINQDTRIKSLVFDKARSIIAKNSTASFHLANSILDYYQGDQAALLLKGMALEDLKKNDEAISIWKELTHSQDINISQKASELISKNFSKKAKQISDKESPRQALLDFIQEHLRHSVTPIINEDIKKILKQFEPPDTHFSDPELQQHQLQLTFNLLVIECLETKFREHSQLGATSEAKTPGAVGKTAPNAG